MAEKKKYTRNTKSTGNKKSTGENPLDAFYNSYANEVTGVILVGFSLLMVAGIFTDRIGNLGRVLRDLCFTMFGVLGYIFPLALFSLGITLILRKSGFLFKRRTVGIILSLTALCVFYSIKPVMILRGEAFQNAIGKLSLAQDISHGGVYGYIIGLPMVSLIGEIGGYIFSFLGLLFGIIMILNLTIKDFLAICLDKYRKTRNALGEFIDRLREKNSQSYEYENAGDYFENNEKSAEDGYTEIPEFMESLRKDEEEDLDNSGFYVDEDLKKSTKEDRKSSDSFISNLFSSRKKNKVLYPEEEESTENIDLIEDDVEDLERINENIIKGKVNSYEEDRLKTFKPITLKEIKEYEKSDIKEEYVDSSDDRIIDRDMEVIDDDSGVVKDIPKLRLSDLRPVEPIALKENKETSSVEKAMDKSAEINTSSRKENIKLGETGKDKGKTETSAPMKPLKGHQISMEEKPKKKYNYPQVDLLRKNIKGKIGEEEQKEIVTNAGKLQDTLMSFGVEAKVLNVSRGPSVTRYELQPKAGIKVSKITNLADDIALSLAASGVRIEAPIPGKSAVGIEIPNKETRPVFLREVIESDKFKNSTQKLAIALGEDISGESVIGDMAKFPHVLIAGATGSGKSVCINSLVVSLLYKYTPEEVKLIMVDPKVVELSVYNGIPHLLIPVVTDPKKATGALHWAVTEMLRRYQAFAENGVKNLEGYNALYEKGRIEEKKPYIVIIVDELADLMMVAANEVEDYILRLSQMARAAGMHLVIATQRPSVDVITGVIKANIPSRISFAVSSYVDSKTILDQSGAEKLLGKGDMLYYPVGAQKPRRVQGAFISEEEVEAIVEEIKDSGSEAEYDESVLQHIESGAKGGNDASSDDEDELMDEAVRVVVENNQASTSFLQRKMKIGYSRAARIMDSLEARGIISPPDGSKPRRILYKPSNLDIE